MKTIKYLLIVCICCSMHINANAQLGTWLKQKKEEAKQKANAKIDQKASEGIDKAVNAPETAVKKKQEKKKNKKDAAAANTATTSNEMVNTDEVVIATNITCATGKSTIENLLRDTDGVNSASIDISSGKVYLSAGGDKNIYDTVVELIRKNGFNADGKKATVKTNACK